MLTVTKAGFGENRTVAWFVRMLLRLPTQVRKFLADAGYDGYRTRLLVIDQEAEGDSSHHPQPQELQGEHP
jgi:hypothetical protein